MKKFMMALTAGIMLLAASCSKGGGVKLNSGSDSLAYIIGMNVGMNLRQMDSTLNADAVCEGIRAVLQGNALLTTDEARTYYLRYITYEEPEKIRAYEEKFLEDFRQSNRSYARSDSGLTYSVEEVGNEQLTPANSRDTVVLRYVLQDVAGQQLYSSYDRKDTLRTTLGGLVKGLQEGVRLIGKGGKMQVWVPAALAYGAAGDEKLGVKSNATLYYEVELVDVQPFSGNRPSQRHDF